MRLSSGLLRRVVRKHAVHDAGVRRLYVTKDGTLTYAPALAYGAFTPRLTHGAVSCGRGAPALSLGYWPCFIRAQACAAFARGCRSAKSPFGAGLYVIGLLESWRGHGCALGFMVATFQRKQFPPPLRGFLWDTFFALPDSPRSCDRCAVQPAHSPPAGSQQGRTGAILFSPKGKSIIANTGTVTADKDGFTGTLRTLTLDVKVKLVPNGKGNNENAPDFRLQAASHDVGAACRKTSEAGRDFLSVTVNDPTFPATVYARLIEGEDGTHDLIWLRSKPQAA